MTKEALAETLAHLLADARDGNGRPILTSCGEIGDEPGVIGVEMADGTEFFIAVQEA